MTTPPSALSANRRLSDKGSQVVPATGDTVGNNGAVAVRHNYDGSTTLRVANARTETGIFLTRAQAVALAAALLGPSAPLMSAS